MYVIKTIRTFSDGSILKRFHTCDASDAMSACRAANAYIGEWDTAQVMTDGRVIYTVKR